MTDPLSSEEFTAPVTETLAELIASVEKTYFHALDYTNLESVVSAVFHTVTGAVITGNLNQECIDMVRLLITELVNQAIQAVLNTLPKE